MYLGVHTLADVAESLLLTFLLIWITVIVFASDCDTVNKKRELIVSLVMIVYSVVIIVIAAVLYSNATIAHNYVSDCLKAAGACIGFAVGMYIERVYIDFSVKTNGLIWQAIKFVIGIAGVLVVKEGLKLIIGTGLVADMFRYFLMLIWVLVLFPLIIKRFIAIKAA